MNLVIDIGNSAIKVAAIDGCEIQRLEVCEELSEKLYQSIEEMVINYNITQAIVSSTRGEQSEVIKRIAKLVDRVVEFTPDTPIPMPINYLTPKTLGRDRVAAVLGAREIYGDQNMVIIDCGTAITIDLYTTTGGFEGGYISPGISMRLRALNEQTASLPLCRMDERWEAIEIGRSTEEAIVGGVIKGVLYELEGHIATYNDKFDKISVIFIGGEAKYFDKRIKNVIFAYHNLVIVGLNRILLYNVKK